MKHCCKGPLGAFSRRGAVLEETQPLERDGHPARREAGGGTLCKDRAERGALGAAGCSFSILTLGAFLFPKHLWKLMVEESDLIGQLKVNRRSCNSRGPLSQMEGRKEGWWRLLTRMAFEMPSSF